MNSINYIKQALEALQKNVEEILLDTTIPMNEKDNKMLILLREKKVLVQTLEDLEYLYNNPPSANTPCGISKYRDD